MGRFFFHFYDGRKLCTDDDGLEMADSEQAYMEAVAAARAMWSELLSARIDPFGCAFEVVDEQGESLFRLPFGELVEACRSPSRKSRSELAIWKELERSQERARRATHDLKSGLKEARHALAEAADLIRRLNRATGSGI